MTARQEMKSVKRTGLIKIARGQFEPRVSLRKPVNVGLIAELAAERFGRVPVYTDRPFAWDPLGRTELDYVEFATLVGEMSAALVAAGVKPWDRVAIVKTPNYDIQALAWAVARIGAIPAMLSAHLDPDITGILLERLQARFVITDQAVADRTGLTPERLGALGCTAIGPVEGGIPVEALWGGPVPAPAPRRDDEPMMITHTSSTTGVSKLAEASASGLTFTARIEARVPFAHSSHELFASAISHVHVRAAVTQMAAFSRGTPLLGIAQPDDETIVRLFGRYRPTIVEAHPNAFVSWEGLADHPDAPFSNIRIFFNTFDAIHPRTIRTLLGASQRRFPVWMQAYGMTEALVVSLGAYSKRTVPRETSRRSRRVGWPAPGVGVRIADPATGEARSSQSEPGMIQVKSPAIALSFVGTPDKYEQRRHGEWFDTGDWGRRGGFGQVEVLDRVADRIDGVESCLWIEDVLLDRIPQAEEIVVVPDEHGKPVPVICMGEGASLDAETWRTASRGLTGLGEPFEVTADELQRTATVKARRYLLTDMIKGRHNGQPTVVGSEVLLRDGA
jgi:acyl-coenzyme A synthetase/AMP-(fatty) acid ligase